MNLAELRRLNVVLAHPRDRDGDQLLRQLQRIGCAVRSFWPLPEPVPEPVDLILCDIEHAPRAGCPWVAGSSPAALVALLSVESVGSAAVADWAPQAVLVKPVEPAALLTSLEVARNNFLYEQRLLTKIAKLEETLKSIRKVERAKAILMKKRMLEEPDAYEYLRSQAMKKRLPIAAIAAAVIESDEILT